MVQPLNFFAPYERMPAYFENQLTRALLVVLKFSPIAHACWLHLIEPNERLEVLPLPQLRTQTARVLEQQVSDLEQMPIRGVSVLLAPDPRAPLDTPRSAVQESQRDQILDGVIQYGDQLVVVIENKLIPGARTEQPTQLNLHGVPIRFDPQIREISWQKVLEVFSDLSVRQLVSGAERLLIDDFLEYVEHHFPYLGPYSTLRRCAQVKQRVMRRLDKIAALASGQEERGALGDGWRELPARRLGGTTCVDMMQLTYDEGAGDVVLRLYPGDTLTQARILYGRPEVVRDLCSLGDWRVQSNFHWGFRTTGYAWSSGSLGPSAYAEYWVARIESQKSIPREDWPAAWEQLIADGIVSAAERPEFDRHFTNTARHIATPRPGLVCIYRWSIDTCKTLDDAADRLADEVRNRVNEILVLLRELPIATPPVRPIDSIEGGAYAVV